MSENLDDLVFHSSTLPCGRVIRNRLVKVAMYEHLATITGGLPNPSHLALYKCWARSSWGMVITGNVQVSPSHITLGRDMVIPDGQLTPETLLPFTRLASAIHGGLSNDTGNPAQETLAIMQLSHAGRQSPNFLGGRLPFVRPLAPSPIPVGRSGANGLVSRLFHQLLFRKPRAMSLADIDNVIVSFVKGSVLAHQAGFDGVQLHAAHGYLLAQFISPKSNVRTDSYSSTGNNALNLLKQIITSIRAEPTIPQSFVLGVKLNAGDYTESSSSPIFDVDSGKTRQENVALQHVSAIAGWDLDFIEISGGDYETPQFMSTPKSPRQAIFSEFSHRAMEVLVASQLGERRPLILLTGGLISPFHLHTALASNHADILGIGRAAVTCPNLPSILRRALDVDDSSTQLSTKPFSPQPSLSIPFEWLCRLTPTINLVGAGVSMAWYLLAIRNLSTTSADFRTSRNPSHPLDYSMSGLSVIFCMWFWTGPNTSTSGNYRLWVAWARWNFLCIIILVVMYKMR